jgi:hypothetical protein
MRRSQMTKKGNNLSVILIILIVFLLFFPSFLLSKYRYAPDPRSDIYFGHVSYSQVKYDGKDPVVLREGEQVAEVAGINFPLAPGDIIRTTEKRRCEIQFDSGTVIRLDLATELKIETILAQTLSSRYKLTNFVLNKGQIYIMYRKYNSREIFQVVTPNAALKLKHKAVALIKAAQDGSTDIQLNRGKAYALYGADENKTKRKTLEKLERLTVSREHQAVLAEYEPDVDFIEWNEYINENFLELHEGKSYLPKPIQRLPKAVMYFAQFYSNRYGQWIWDSLYGYVWRPYYNDRYPWGTWSPYVYGKWRELNGQLFWVPEEPWGWVPYHLGLWTWDEKQGWVWIPGSAFAPAWATWDFLEGYYAWRPWMMLDWYYPYGYGSYYYYYPFYLDTISRESSDSPEGKKRKRDLQIIRKSHLKKQKNSPYPLPKALKQSYMRFVSALEAGDERVIASIKNIAQHLVFVKSQDLNAPRIQEKILKFGQMQKKIESFGAENRITPIKNPQNPYRKAVSAFKRNAVVAQLRELITSYITKEKPSSWRDRNYALSPKTKEVTPSPAMRFRDWNPDVKNAQRLGVEIKYSSRANEIRCPALGLSSRNVAVSRGGFISRGFYSSGSGSSSYSSSSSGSSGGSSRTGSASSTASSGSSSSKSSSGREK